MTLEEAIKHCYEVAEEKCDECGKEHLQLAKWLEEFRTFKNKADFVEVVRCGKCKYGDVSVFSKTKDGEEDIACYCTLKKVVTNVDSYCPSGRRGDT